MPSRLASCLLLMVLSLHSAVSQEQTQRAAASEKDIMNRIYGNYDAATHSSRWKPTSIPADYEDFFNNGIGEAELQLDRTVPVGNSTERFVVTSTNTNHDDCHACAVLLSAMVFHGGEASPSVREDFLTVDGQFGNPPITHLLRLGRDHVAIELEDAFGNSGSFGSYLTLFAEIGGNLKQLIALHSGERFYPLEDCYTGSKDGDCGFASFCFSQKGKKNPDFDPDACTSWSGAIRVASPQTPKGWSDLIMTQTVHAAAPGAFKGPRYSSLLRFKADHYEILTSSAGHPRIDAAD